jgi:hypothetical protein
MLVRHVKKENGVNIQENIYARGEDKSRETPQMRKYFPSTPNTLSVSWVRKGEAMTSRFSKNVSWNAIYTHTEETFSTIC